ncbi:MAG TPA: hypothetical protein VHN80_06255 [Kineosporiaceae bacterium]|nr:hypothetical protein [Kineosporiaceae bacterium]
MVRRTLLVGCDTPRCRQTLALLSGIGGPGAWSLHRAYLACNAEQVARGAAAPNSITGCSAQLRGYAVADLWFLTATSAGVILGLVSGVTHGRRRGTWTRPRSLPTAICTAVGICLAAPAFAVAYLVGYGRGRLLGPRGTPRVIAGVVPQQADQQPAGGEAAAALHRHLAAGGDLPRVRPVDFLADDVVHLDTAMQYARYYSVDLQYRSVWAWAYGPPWLVLGAIAAQGLANASAAARARALAAAQWREFQWTRVIVTSRSTWCWAADGRWREFAHDAVIQYRTDGCTTVLIFEAAEPLMLSGPGVCLHAVIFARLRLGPQRWQDAPWLDAVAGGAF